MPEKLTMDPLCRLTMLESCAKATTISVTAEQIPIEVLSDQPGLQVYSGNFFDGKSTNTIAALFWHRNDEKNTSLMIHSGDYYGIWWYSKD